MPLECRHTKDIVWHASMAASSFMVQHWGDPGIYGPKKVLLHVEKNDIIWSMSMTLKTKNTLATYNVYFNEMSDITFKG